LYHNSALQLWLAMLTFLYVDLLDRTSTSTRSFKAYCSALQLWLAMLTFLYVDFLDTTGTLFSMANFMNNFIPGAAPRPACCSIFP
jgi:xanthine/uracil/vitamin C permease (AzgA family)